MKNVLFIFQVKYRYYLKKNVSTYTVWLIKGKQFIINYDYEISILKWLEMYHQYFEHNIILDVNSKMDYWLNQQ